MCAKTCWHWHAAGQLLMLLNFSAAFFRGVCLISNSVFSRVWPTRCTQDITELAAELIPKAVQVQQNDEPAYKLAKLKVH